MNVDIYIMIDDSKSLRDDNLYNTIIEHISNYLKTTPNVMLERIIYICKCDGNSYVYTIDVDYNKLYNKDDYSNILMFDDNVTVQDSINDHIINDAVGELLKCNDSTAVRIISNDDLRVFMLPCYTLVKQLSFLEQFIYDIYKRTLIHYMSMPNEAFVVHMSQLLKPTISNKGYKEYYCKYTDKLLYGLTDALTFIYEHVQLNTNVIYGFNLYTYIKGHKCISTDSIVFLHKSDNPIVTPLHTIDDDTIKLIEDQAVWYASEVKRKYNIDVNDLMSKYKCSFNMVLLCHILSCCMKRFFKINKAVHLGKIKLFIINTPNKMVTLYGIDSDDTIKAIITKELRRLTVVVKDQNNALISKDDVIRSKDNIIVSKDDIIKQKDDIIKQKDEELKSKDDIIKQKDAIIASKDAEIARLNEEIAKLNTELANTNAQIITTLKNYIDSHK